MLSVFASFYFLFVNTKPFISPHAWSAKISPSILIYFLHSSWWLQALQIQEYFLMTLSVLLTCNWQSSGQLVVHWFIYEVCTIVLDVINFKGILRWACGIFPIPIYHHLLQIRGGANLGKSFTCLLEESWMPPQLKMLTHLCLTAL